MRHHNYKKNSKTLSGCGESSKLIASVIDVYSSCRLARLTLSVILKQERNNGIN